jgi:hypothetical protein
MENISSGINTPSICAHRMHLLRLAAREEPPARFLLVVFACVRQERERERKKERKKDLVSTTATASENGMPTAIAPHYENKRPLPLLYHGKKSKHTDIKNELTVNVHNVSLRIRCIIDCSNRSNLSKSIKPLKIADTYKIRSKPLRFYPTVKISKQLKIAQTAQCTKQ